MTKKRTSYSKQCTLDAVRLVAEQGDNVSEAARNLGIDHNTPGRWKKQLETNKSAAFPGK